MKNIPLPSRILNLLAAGCLLALSAGSAMAAAPEIGVKQGTTAIGDGGSHPFGSIAVGSSGSPVTFTIANTGDANLTGFAISKTGTNAADFSVTAVSSSAPVAGPTGTTTFTVTFSPSARGTRNAAISIANNDSDENPYNISFSGTGLAPEIAVSQGGNINSGGSKGFGNVNLGSSTSLTFTISNTGDAPLTGLVASLSGTHDSDYSITTQPTPPVNGPTGTTTCIVEFTPGARGTRDAILEITHNDPDGSESPFAINLSGTGVAPEIAVIGRSSSPIASNGTQPFGNVLLGNTVNITFTIQNTGNADLTGLAITKSGTDAADFEVTQDPVSPVNDGDDTTFEVKFTPGATGNKTASLSITNNDPDGNESPYIVNLAGDSATPTVGTDAFGYIYTSPAPINQLTLASSDPDVTVASELTGDDRIQSINIGFPFFFYDQSYSSVWASTNGLLSFGTGSPAYSPSPISSAGTPNNFIAPFWTDLYVGAGSKVLYATRGVAPDRVFIIEYQNMEEYSNSSASVSFQVLLHESNNSIEIQFKGFSGFSTTRNLSIGIEGPTGTVGYSHNSGTARPTVPNAITFERPVVVTLESKFQKPDGSTADIGNNAVGLDPEIGDIKAPYNSVRRFEAPEFIYLDKNFNQLTGPGDFATDLEDDLAYYRLVNDGYAIDGQVIQGTHTFFTTTLTHDITVIWRWKLEYAAIIQAVDVSGSPLNVGEGIGAPSPGFGRHWVPKDTEFSASIARAVGDDAQGASVSGLRFNAQNYSVNLTDGSGGRIDSGVIPLGTTGDRVVTVPITVEDWVRVTWTMVAQVRYRFDASGLETGASNVEFDGMSFVRINGGAPVFGSGPSMDVWLDAGATNVEVGGYYRTADRRYTMTNFIAAPDGDLAAVGSDISNLSDITVNSTLARVFPVPVVTGPTTVHWLYDKTVFRAIVPLGTGAGVGFSFVPALPNNSVLGDTGPDKELPPVGQTPDGTSTGSPWRWDQVGKEVFPVRPGSNQFEWSDQNDPDDRYVIELVSGYPGDDVRLATAEEELDGTRKIAIAGTPPVYDFTASLEAVESEFPAYPGAHYRHLLKAGTRQPPTKLDISDSDHWSFQELTYTDKDTGADAEESATGIPFKANVDGRTVLLYSYRPNSDEAANGDLSKERLAVRVVESMALAPISRTDSKLVLGHHGLQFGKGSSTSGNAFGVVQNGMTPATANVTPGERFIVDFWLNTKDLAPSAPVTIDGCTTVSGSVTLICSSTADLVPGMSISGTGIPVETKILSIVDGTTLMLGKAATGSESDLSLTASNMPITVVTTGGSGLQVTLDPEASTVTATYHGVPVTHEFSRAGTGWRHHVMHVFTTSLFGIDVTVFDYYLDGIRKEQNFVSSWFPGSAASTVGTTVSESSLRFGVNATPASGLILDQFRMFSLGSDPKGYLNGGEIRQLRTERDMTLAGRELRSEKPMLWFSFEGTPAGGQFANHGTLPNVAVGPVSGSGPYPETWANVDLQEVATRIDSTLDNAGFRGTGFVVNAVSNYNAELWDRDAEVGTWGPLFPVNVSGVYGNANKLEVAYYENPYLADSAENPNVAWPYISTEFQDVVFPVLGPDKDKRIYIASRIGSEGVDFTGRPQKVYDLAGYADLKVYQQSDPGQAGYNPNEEHALAAGSGRAALKVKSLGDGIPNNPPLAAFALQKDANQTTVPYTSEPWVLVQVTNLLTGEPEMAAYGVRKTRSGSISFPRPTNAVVQATPGLAYESADNPEDRFLTLNPTGNYNFTYKFDFPVFAGDLVIPPYPLNIVIGNVSMQDERGGNIQTGGINRRTLWRDVNRKAWVVSGDGKFFNQFFYPMRGDFYLPSSPANGTPVAWLPTDTDNTFIGTGTDLEPVKVIYSSKWRSDYPKLKRGETLTYQGGESFSENPGSNGLPALVAMKAAEIVYDSSTPDMVIAAATPAEVAKTSAQIIRPLDRREITGIVPAQMAAAGFSPAATAKVLVIAERWYFKDLAGSLGKRLYYDSLATKLVFRGYLNDKDSGDPDLTAGPDPLNLLEPNVMTLDEYTSIRALSDNGTWEVAIDDLFRLCQNPNEVGSIPTSLEDPVFLQGVKTAPADGGLPEVKEFWKPDLSDTLNTSDPVLSRLDSFGVGAALVPNASLLTQNPDGSLYITIAENNRSELAGAPVSLHIIEIVPDRYRGAIKVVESSDAFSEKVMLIHNGDFGSNTGDIYYEWWIRDSAPLDVVAAEVLPDGTLKETDASGNTLWQEYVPNSRLEDGTLTDATRHHGLNTTIFEGRPDVTLADKLVLVRYRHKTESNWTLVPFEFANPSVAWMVGDPAPFQWAGAANSPQLQADGSKRYVPQLVMGWVKRVLDRINPYEARYTDFFSNESPATYSSQIQIAGGPFAGKVALNPDKNVIENTGLIELYETVLQRAVELSIGNSSNPVSTAGINQALLLAATRLSVLYELLGSEAYSDAQDPTITVTDESGLASVASFTHAFQNMESDLMHEELALLRGTDFRKSYPVYNRMFWNYAKGLGEAAYNVNYNIYDENTDGFINEDDARALYPQGHGDAWGHYASSIGMHYTLLQHPGFSWRTRSELYSLMQNVLEVDFLDEKTFARLAAARARAGRDIVRDTYRVAYTQDPDGQWQGYTDAADPARAWGVSEWAHRAGQAAYFDWGVANALLPEDAGAATPVENPENLDRIERSGAIDEIGVIAGSLHEIQLAMDEANSGVNPLGFDSDALAFDLDLEFYENASGGDRRTHFEQIYTRAVAAGENAKVTLDFAALAENKLRLIADDTDSMIVESLRQDLDYRNQLIEIFGRPFDGTIGFGQAYPEGYLGADTLLFSYMERTTIDEIVPPVDGPAGTPSTTVTFNTVYDKAKLLMDDPTMVSLYSWPISSGGERTQAFETLVGDNLYLLETPPNVPLTLPYDTASRYGFVSDPTWGRRTSYGKIQTALENMLLDEIALDQAIADYIGFLGDWEGKTQRLDNELDLFATTETTKDVITGIRATVNTLLTIQKSAQLIADSASETALYGANGIAEGFPTVLGFSNDATSAPRGIARVLGGIGWGILKLGSDGAQIAALIAELARDETIAALERDIEQLGQISAFEGMVEDLASLSGSDQPKRDTIAMAIQTLEMHRQEYVTAQAEGFRLLREREAFNKILAAKVQKNRYQDMILRLSRNEAMSKYQSAFNNAARYTWLAAKAYDYETSLDPGDSAAPGAFLDRIVKERQLGLWGDGPQTGQGGLAEILNQLNGNFQVLKGQLGLGNPQGGYEKISLRSELFRIQPSAAGSAASDDRWEDALKARIVPDLTKMPEFVRYCRPFSTPAEGPQPGIVIRFGTHIANGVNIFGNALAPGDHSYSTANYATKIRGVGVWLENYNAAGLSTTPRAYLVPIGTDYLRTSSAQQSFVRMWNVQEQRIPTPFVINPGELSAPGYIPTLDGVDGAFGQLRRHGDFRMYHDDGDPNADDGELALDTRLISRSVWNSEWMLVIPGAGLHLDPLTGVSKLSDSVSDIKLHFNTYSHQGQ